MIPGELVECSVKELGELLASRQVSPVEVINAFVERADRLDATIGAFITRTAEQALEEAKRVEQEIISGKYRGPLHGIPFGAKDIYWTEGIRTTSGSRIEADFVPTRDATAVSRLRRAGAILLGKTNTVEFAFDPTGRNAHYGMPSNPWDSDRMPGGSSSGSGAAIAAGFVPIALGSDTGGSIRIPSALCGISGIKPSFGLVSRMGVTPLSYSLDTAGPMARGVEDLALALEVLAGHDPEDPASQVSAGFDCGLVGDNERLDDVRIGVPSDYVWDIMDAEVRAAFWDAMKVFEDLGARISDLRIPELDWVPSIAVTITTAEAAAVHGERVRTEGQAYDPAVRRRIETGMFIGAADYAKALRARALLAKRVGYHFRNVDLIATPTVPVPAPLKEETVVDIGGEPVNTREALLRLTRIFNLTRMPAVALPSGFTSTGLPVGFQLAAPSFEDARALRAANVYQKVTAWHRSIASI